MAWAYPKKTNKLSLINLNELLLLNAHLLKVVLLDLG